MRSAKSQATALAARLTALTGREARTREVPAHIRIEVDLPGRLTDSRRLSLLAALADADRYGHDLTAHGALIWAEMDQ